jgi:hypothetical protein
MFRLKKFLQTANDRSRAPRGRKQIMISTERRHHARRHSDNTHVYLYAHGESTQHCKVRDISNAGMFIEINTTLLLLQPVELAFTCLYTHHIVKIYRRSAYIARTSEDGVAVLLFDRRLSYPVSQYTAGNFL